MLANRISTSVACALTLCTSAAAQVTPLWTFESAPGGTEPVTYAVRDTTSDAAGNVVVVGHHIQVGVPFPANTSDPFTILFHPDGSFWDSSAFEIDDVSSFGVAVSPLDGSVYTADQNYDQHKISVTKRTSAGTFVWRTPSVSGVQWTTTDCLLDAAENLYVGSTTQDPPRMVLTSWDSAGALRFSTAIAASAQFSCIAMDPAGDLILGGSNPVLGGSNFATIAKVSRMGVVQWTYPTNIGSSITALVCDATGGFYTLINGNRLQQFDSSGSPGWSVPAEPPAALAVDRQQCVVLCSLFANALITRRFDPNGNLLWQRDWSVPGYERAYTAAVGIDVAGNALIDASLVPPGSGVHDGAYLSYTPAGDLRWSGVLSSNGERILPAAMLPLPHGTFAIPGVNAASIGFAPRLYVTELQAQSIGLCFGDGSSTACPCSNDSAPGDQRGCANSAGSAARLADSGIASVTNDTLVLTSSGETPAASTLIFQGTASVTATTFGDGLRCVGGSIRRLYSQSATAGVVSVPQPGDASISAQSAAGGDVLVTGSRRYYQAWYRDASPAFCPAPNGNTWNVSSALLVTWAP